MGVQFHFKLHCKAPRASPCRRCLFSWFPARNTATTKNMRARTLAFRPRMPPEHLCQFGCPLNMDAQSQATGPDQCTSGFSMPSLPFFVVPCQKQPQKHARTLLHVFWTMPLEHLGQFGCPANMETPMDSNMTGPRHLGLLHAIVAFLCGSLPETQPQQKNMRARTLAFRPRMPPEHLCQFGCPLNMDAQSQATGPDQCTSGFSMPSVAVFVVPCQKQPQKHARTLLHVILDHASGASWPVRMSCRTWKRQWIPT